MNIRHTIYLLAAVAMVACSGSDDVWKLASDDHQHLSKDGALSDVPISFAPVEIANLQWGVEPVSETRGGSVNADEFTADSFGVFCLAKLKLAAAPEKAPMSWSRTFASESNKKHNVWTENEMASVKSIGGNKGEMVWSDEHQLLYYSSDPWYTYGFAAYHPWTEHVVFSKSSIIAYIKVDGNDDVMCAVANAPETTFGERNADVDELAFSKQYYDSIRTRNLSWAGTFPKFEFKHLLTRLDFYFKLENTPTKNIHVDKVEFDDFPCIVKLPLVNGDFTNGKIISYASTSTTYVLNDNADQLGSIKLNDNSYLKDDPKFSSAFGHFELREKGETPISGIKAGSVYKYNLTSEFKKVGDCIIIPPVKSSHRRSTIKLFVTLCDDNGKKFRNSAAITLSAPNPEWGRETRYKVNITLSAPAGYGSSSAPAMRAPATETTADGVTLWQPEATVSISK